MPEVFNTNSNPSTKPQEVMKKFPKGPNKKNLYIVLASFLVVVGGIATGWTLSGAKKTQTGRTAVTSQEVQKSETEAGLTDTSSFDAESPEGTLVEGGKEGDGTYHLERAGGASQNVYLTSTVIDLQSFVGKKVKIWGNTLSAVHAGWLMDVGKIKVID
jgi:hypothetical protein